VFIVFCSDIRTEPATDEEVQINMQAQLAWWQIMNPELSMFKFRLPWKKGTVEYLAGDIYIQPFPGPTSTETRLVVARDAAMVSYDNTRYEEQMYYHNAVGRKEHYDTMLGPLDLKRDALDNCYDCASFIEIILQYLMLGDFNKKDKHAQKTILRKKLDEVQANINFGEDNIYSRTVKYFDKLEKIRKKE